MQYTRVLIAKVALRVATEDEVFWVDQCIKQGCGCDKEIQNIRSLAWPKTPSCGDDLALILVADRNKMPTRDLDEAHLLSCARCAKVGQYIANMANPGAATIPIALVG